MLAFVSLYHESRFLNKNKSCMHTFIPFSVAKEHIFLLQNLLATCVLLYVRLFACLSVQIRTLTL